MRFTQTLYLLLFAAFSSHAQSVQIVTSDVAHYWEAYDQVLASTDSLERIDIMQRLYVDRGSAGLKALMEVRDYTTAELAANVHKYRRYWESIRPHTASLTQDVALLEDYVGRLEAAYPQMQKVPIYFAIGGFRTGGTYQTDKVLLGAEILMAKPGAVIDELPARNQDGLRNYMPFNIPLIALHEFVHVQQQRWEQFSIVHRCVAEGVAEFVSTQLAGTPLSPPVLFGKANAAEVLQVFMEEAVRDDAMGNWLSGQNRNRLVQNDLGYYIGYAVCERVYEAAADKGLALRQLIDLNYADDAVFAAFLDGSGFLPESWAQIGQRYEAMRPSITGLQPFANGSKAVSPKQTYLVIAFSEPMSSCCRSADYDTTAGVVPLPIKSWGSWSADGKYLRVELGELRPQTTYGLVLSNFAKADGFNRSAPYTIRFSTAKR